MFWDYKNLVQEVLYVVSKLLKEKAMKLRLADLG